MNHSVNFVKMCRILLRGLLIFVLVGLMARSGFTSIHSFAAPNESVRLFFSPQNLLLPPNITTSLMIDAKSYNIGFVRVELSFDPSVIILTGEILTTGLVKTVISKTSKDQANASGRILIIIVLAPEDSPPNGIFELAQIPIRPNIGYSNLQTSISFINGGTQIVDVAATTLPTSSEHGLITVNPTRMFLPIVRR